MQVTSLGIQLLLSCDAVSMLIPTQIHRFRLTAEKKRFIRQNLLATLTWPAVCLVLGILLSALLSSLLHSTKRNLEKNALTEVEHLSATYAQQIGRTIGELDHITALLKSSWEHSSSEHSTSTFRLEDVQKKAIFIDTTMVGISLINRDGIIVSSTLPGAVGLSVRDRDYFKFHQTNRSSDLHIGPPLTARLSDKEIITFTRRLELHNGDFDGVICTTTGTPLLAEFANKVTLGSTGILALVGDDGILRAAKIGSRIESVLHPRVIRGPVLGSGILTASISDSSLFRDGVARYLKAEPVPGYPLYTVVGLGQTDVFAPLQSIASTYLQIGIGGICVLALFAAVAFVMSVRLAWRKHREETVRQTYRVATEGANEGFYMWRPIYGNGDEVTDFELVDCNERGAELYGSRKNNLLGARLRELYSGELLEQLLGLAPKIMETGFHEDEFETVNENMAQPAWIYRRFVRTGDGIAVTLRDITERKRLEQERSQLAERDSLTALPNRHWLSTYLPAALARAAAQAQTLAILFVDLDKFKNINDSWGHSTGDKLLHAVANKIRSVLRPEDSIARFGGDEFIVLLEGVVCENDAAEVAKRIGAALKEPFNIMQRECVVGASVGISLYPKDGEDAETLIRNADIAMYTAKSEAKGYYRFFDQHLFAGIQQRLETERQLVQAIEADQFVVHYQPRVHVRSGALVGMEALIRWVHPERALVYPSEFIPIAESSTLILQLGELVMEKVCRQLAQWRAQGLPIVPVSVNASAKQFNEGKVKGLCVSALARHDLPASLIEVELTESTMVNNAEQVFDELRALHALGVAVHLDDFGTGYSSLSILHKLDVDVLKVDQAFTAQLGKTTEGEIFFRAIISMAKALGMRIIAEGVETYEQLRLLQDLGCDEIQGYLVSRPLPAEDISRLCLKSDLPLLRIEETRS